MILRSWRRLIAFLKSQFVTRVWHTRHCVYHKNFPLINVLKLRWFSIQKTSVSLHTIYNKIIFGYHILIQHKLTCVFYNQRVPVSTQSYVISIYEEFLFLKLKIDYIIWVHQIIYVAPIVWMWTSNRW